MNKVLGMVIVGSLLAGPAMAAKAKGDPEAFKARRTQCSQDWKATKVELKAQGVTWPKFWSSCNARLRDHGPSEAPAKKQG